MEYERRGVTITWKIENVKCVRQKQMELYSPVFTVDIMEGTKWRLGLLRMPNSAIRLIIKREAEDDGPEVFGLHYEFSANTCHGLNSSVKRTHSCTFRKNHSCHKITLSGRHMYVTSDHINIRCKMWKQRGSILKTCNFFIRTRMGNECYEFVGMVENFSGLSGGEKKTLKTVSSPIGEGLMTVNFYLYPIHPKLLPRRELRIEINPLDNQAERFFDFKLFVLDSSGNKSDIGKLERKLQKSPVTYTLPTISQEKVLKDASLYLPNDNLFLHCEVTFYSEKEYEEVERIEYETDSVTEENQTSFAKAMEPLAARQGIPCDTNLQTATETFPTHTSILSAQSPVFEAMFQTNMKETIQKRVHIDDADAETVKHMLMFLYSGTLEELEWKDAVKLYATADKYQISSLKGRCTALLQKSIDLSNCCILLLLSDMHKDDNLKRTVQNYITQNDGKVLYCDQWGNLEKNFPQLVINYFRDRCLKGNVF